MLARARCLPGCLSVLSHRHGSPRAALLFQALLGLAFAVFTDASQMLNYVGFSQWSQRTITILLLLQIRLRGLRVSADWWGKMSADREKLVKRRNLVFGTQKLAKKSGRMI